MSLIPALVLSITIALPTECVLDQAVVTAVPPNTVHVITISECGGLKCWHRYVEANGKRLAEARVCAGEGATFQIPSFKETP